jgi:hypothetical protein
LSIKWHRKKEENALSRTAASAGVIIPIPIPAAAVKAMLPPLLLSVECVAAAALLLLNNDGGDVVSCCCCPNSWALIWLTSSVPTVTSAAAPRTEPLPLLPSMLTPRRALIAADLAAAAISAVVRRSACREKKENKTRV